MNRIGELLGRPSAWLGLVGAALLFVALLWAGYVSLVPATAASCPAARAGGPADRMRILDVGAPELALRGSVCLLVDNVVSEASLAQRQAVLAGARLELAQADQAMAAGAAPATVSTPAHYSYRYHRYVPAFTAPAPPAPVNRDAARIRHDAAVARLASASADLAQFAAPRRLVLFLNGERSPAEPRLVRGEAAPQTVTFALRAESRASGERSAYWRDLLGQHNDDGLVPVTLGIAEESQPLPTAQIRATPARNGGMSRPLGFRVFVPAILWLAGAGLALILVGLAGLARTTGLLRDGRSRYSSYSLSRVQMAWWFALTIAGFVYIWLVTGQYLDVIGSATFVLLGIAGATAGAARVVDGPKPVVPASSRGFLADLAGGDRIELHRLQMIAWTMVLGGIYAYNVVANFVLTDFDANLLALAGVVNGVYVGLKTQETE